MFYFEDFQGQKILKSDYLININAFFTTKDNKHASTEFPFKAKNIVIPKQTHSDNIGIVYKYNEFLNTDALILPNTSYAIALKFADCTPLIIYDAKNKIGAIAHAGWRGTASQIGIKTLLKMQQTFSTNPKDVIAVIGPAIGLCCYEVSGDVKEKLLLTVKDKSGLYKDNNVDLKLINARQLSEIGVTKIDICPFCTSCNNDLFYSYRKENGTSYRHFAYMNLGKYIQ